VLEVDLRGKHSDSTSTYSIQVGEIKKDADTAKAIDQLAIRLAVLSQAADTILNFNLDADEKLVPSSTRKEFALNGCLFYEGSSGVTFYEHDKARVKLLFPGKPGTVTVTVVISKYHIS